VNESHLTVWRALFDYQTARLLQVPHNRRTTAGTALPMLCRQALLYGRSVPQGLLRVHPDLERETDHPISFRDAGAERHRNAI
jgi:hypothetical protein